MAIPQTVFENNDKAAHAVYDHLNRLTPSPNRFTLRPHNFYAPEFTYWWFVPSTDWPAFRYGKLTLHRWPIDNPQAMYAGIYVEKGLGKQLLGMPGVQQNRIIQADWFWHEFVRRVRDREVELTIAEVLERSRGPVVICVDAYHFNHIPKEDSEHPLSAPDDWTEFLVHSKEDNLHVGQPGSEILAQLKTCIDISELIERIQAMKDLDFYWIDVFIGVRLQYGTTTTGNWGASEIWNKALQPWATWVM